MIEEIKILLGDSASNFTDAQIQLCLKMSVAEIEAYCKRDLDAELEIYLSGVGKVKFEFTGSTDVKAICRLISEYTLRLPNEYL